MLKTLTYIISKPNHDINIDAINSRFDRVCVLDSNDDVNSKTYIQSSKLIAVGLTRELVIHQSEGALDKLEKFYQEKKCWLFGYLSYDLKNGIEDLDSANHDGLNFPLLHFFSPKFVIQIQDKHVSIFYDDEYVLDKDADEIFELYINFSSNEQGKSVKNKAHQNNIHIQSRISKQEYIASVNQLKQHIRNGDIYEVNFCQEYFSKNAQIDPLDIFQKMNFISMSPFAAYCKFGTNYLICTSPERFIKKNSNRLISQPIKGTSKRSENIVEDEQLKLLLRENEKERSENVMIVDLVRNDLSRIAKRGTVNVDELFGVYSFKQVHQLISTISCELKEDVAFSEIIKCMFPMGSMTGAPKISAMKLIEQYESTKRGLYSGAVGYIDPNGDFDFNVVIRSILYNSQNNYLSFMVGSAITDKAIPEDEYAECLLKAKAMFEVLQVNPTTLI